jgi:hypothetical protein
VDFWDHQREEAKKRTDTMWVVKATKSGILGSCYHPKDSYWAGDGEDGSINLSGAQLYKTKGLADEMLVLIDSLNNVDKELPEFKTVQIMLSEV